MNTIVSAISHGIACRKLPACRVACDDNRSKIREDLMPCKRAHDFVDHIKRSETRAVRSCPTIFPVLLAPAEPGKLVGCKLVTALSTLIASSLPGCETGRNDNRRVEGVGKKACGNGTSVIVIGVSGRSVNYNQRADDKFILCVERVSPIQQQTSGSPGNSQPLYASGNGTNSWRGPSMATERYCRSD